MAITACGRWALNVTAGIIGALGYDFLYGDTDSVMFTLKGNSNSIDAFMIDDRYRPIQNHVDVLTRDSRHISMLHLCEYLAVSSGSEDLYPRRMSTICGLVPKIVNHVMSYTYLVDLKIERQDTGVQIGNSIQSGVYKSFVLLTKKHYSAMLHDDTHITKGISFVRRSGAVITDIAYRRFINVMQRYHGQATIIDAIKNDYRVLRAQIISDRSTTTACMVVRSTVMGITDDYINVLVGPQRNPVRVLKLEYNSNTMVYDKRYYIDLLERCVDRVLGALKIADPGFIKTISVR